MFGFTKETMKEKLEKSKVQKAATDMLMEMVYETMDDGPKKQQLRLMMLESKMHEAIGTLVTQGTELGSLGVDGKALAEAVAVMESAAEKLEAIAGKKKG